MNIVDLPLESISAPGWNSNDMDGTMQSRLRRSIERFGLVAPLVVRRVAQDSYQTVGGAQRLAALRDIGTKTAP